MSNNVFRLNYAGVRELLTSEEMKSICKSYADAAQSKLGDGYEVTTYTGENRVNASVKAVTYKARKDNSENNSIIKAVFG